MSERDIEIEVLQALSDLLVQLDEPARIRVLWWALAKFCPLVPEHIADKVLAAGRQKP